jgi:hypothetical protein
MSNCNFIPILKKGIPEIILESRNGTEMVLYIREQIESDSRL